MSQLEEQAKRYQELLAERDQLKGCVEIWEKKAHELYAENERLQRVIKALNGDPAYDANGDIYNDS